jgi:hypothetical protein
MVEFRPLRSINDSGDVLTLSFGSKHIPKQLQELGFFTRQSPAVKRSKTGPYSNIGLFLIFQPRAFRAVKKPINEVVWVYHQVILKNWTWDRARAHTGTST